MDNYLKMLQDYVSIYGIKILSALAILVIGLWIAKLVTRHFSKTLTKKEFDPTLTKFLTTFVRIVLTTIVIIAAIDETGFGTISFVAILGSAGLAIGLALQGSLSNFASGVMLVIFRPIKVGDYIEGGGVKGTVEEIGIFVTILTSPDNKVIFVPNSKMTSDSIVNYNVKDTRRVDMIFGIGYKEDINKARQTINEVIKSNPKILKDPEPKIVVSELGESSVNFAVRPWCKTADYWEVYFGVTEAIKMKFDEQNIEIPFPQRDVHIHQN
ncbi:MAG: mechanosensitive ion channel [Melioribacteraceae bacterium]|nr:mechanosensitive ion channel [Melioribacteraceae bacterium]